MKHSPMTFQELADSIEAYTKERNWIDMAPSDLAKSIMLEGAELLEHFQWDNTLAKRGSQLPQKDKEAIASEVSDILIYLMEFCQAMEIDVVDAVQRKIEKVKKKYPVGYAGSDDGDLHHEEYLKIKQAHRE